MSTHNIYFHGEIRKYLSGYCCGDCGTVGLISSFSRAPDLQAGGRGFESCIGHTFSSLDYFNGDKVN